MSLAIVVILATTAALGFAGAGIALAAARTREVIEVAPDLGMRIVAVLLFLVASSSIFAINGISGIFAFGGAISWFSYVVSAHRLRVFWVEQPSAYQEPAAERKRIA